MNKTLLSVLIVVLLEGGLTAALATLLAPPSETLLFVIVGLLFGLLSLGVLYVIRSKLVPGTREKTGRYIALGAVALLALLAYLWVYSSCIVKATRAEFQDAPPVSFPIWLTGRMAEDRLKLGSRVAMVNKYTPDILPEKLSDMPGITILQWITQAVFLALFLAIVLSLNIAFGMLAMNALVRRGPIPVKIHLLHDPARGFGTATRFRVALSFPGEDRGLVQSLAELLAERLHRDCDRDCVFYDDWYRGELARFNLDDYLLDIYLNQSKLVAVFICGDYQKKEWCGLEWRAIRELVKKRHDDQVMPIRIDDGDVSGFLSIDGYLDARGRPPSEICDDILDRLALLERREAPQLNGANS